MIIIGIVEYLEVLTLQVIKEEDPMKGHPMKGDVMKEKDLMEQGTILYFIIVTTLYIYQEIVECLLNNLNQVLEVELQYVSYGTN